MFGMARRMALVAFVFALLSGSAAAAGAPPDGSAAAAAASGTNWIVVLRDDVADPAAAADELGRKRGFTAKQTYTDVLKGFAASMSPAAAAALKSDPRVAYVQPDGVVRAEGRARPAPVPAGSETVPSGVRRIGADRSTSRGAGVHVAVLDTGIDLDHPDLAANIAKQGVNCVGGGAPDDDNGHGTHVAGVIAAAANGQGVVGVAPRATLHAVKVLDAAGNGSWSQVICGLDWVTRNAKRDHISVVNMSLVGGGDGSTRCGVDHDALHDAICRVVKRGVTVVAAAGNGGLDAGYTVPAAYPEVIAVSALSDHDGLPGLAGREPGVAGDDSFPDWSNYGAAVSMAAPGVDILSTWVGGGYATMSGTSMASPHVAGALALYLASHRGRATPASLRQALRRAGECVDGAPGRRAAADNCATAWPDDAGPFDRRHEPLTRATGW